MRSACPPIRRSPGGRGRPTRVQALPQRSRTGEAFGPGTLARCRELYEILLKAETLTAEDSWLIDFAIRWSPYGGSSATEVPVPRNCSNTSESHAPDISNCFGMRWGLDQRICPVSGTSNESCTLTWDVRGRRCRAELRPRTVGPGTALAVAQSDLVPRGYGAGSSQYRSSGLGPDRNA